MCVIVGKCGGLWWEGNISDCGMGANVGDCDSGEIFSVVGWGHFGVCGLRDVQIFTNFDIFKKFLILTFFHHHHFVLRNINIYQNVTKIHHFPYTLQIFRMCVSDTLPHFPLVYLTKCQNNRYSFE